MHGVLREAAVAIGRGEDRRAPADHGRYAPGRIREPIEDPRRKEGYVERGLAVAVAERFTDSTQRQCKNILIHGCVR